MKKIFAIILTIFLYTQSFWQLIQASVSIGSQPNRIKIWLKSDVTQTPSTLSTLQFNVGVDATGLVTPPTITIISSSIAGAIWSQNPSISEGGYYNYNIFIIINKY